MGSASHDDELLTLQELALRLKVRPSWIYDQVRLPQDPLPHYKMGKYLRFRWPEVAEWLDRRRNGRGRCQPTPRASTLPREETAGRVTAGKE